MSKLTKNIPLNCPICRSAKFEGPENPGDTDTVICTNCGHSLTAGNLKSVNKNKTKKEAEKVVKSELEKQLKKTLGNRFKAR